MAGREYGIIQREERFLRGTASNQPQKQSRDCLESTVTPKTIELTEIKPGSK